MSRKVITKYGYPKTIHLKNSIGKRLLKRADVVEIVDMEKTADLWPDSMYPKRRMILNDYRQRSVFILHKQDILYALNNLLKEENFMPPGYEDLVG